MLDARELKPQDLAGLTPEAIAQLAQQLLGQLHEQAAQLKQRDERIERQTREIQFKDTKLQKVTFELARLKAWKFGAKSEAMNAEQRRLFEETLAEDEASLRAQLEQLQTDVPAGDDDAARDGMHPKRRPKRQALPTCGPMRAAPSMRCLR